VSTPRLKLLLSFIFAVYSAAGSQSATWAQDANTSGIDADDVATLAPIQVRSYEPTPAEDAAANYTVRRSSSATKLDLTIKETPQSLTIVTQKQIEDQNLQQVGDILRFTPGVAVQEFGVPGAGRATFFARGYEINNFQIDGMPTSASMFGGADLMASMDTALYERVEIIRGSTGLTSGPGDPSASINFVRKRPDFVPLRRASVSYGTWAKRRADVDISQPFNDSGSLRGRMVAVAARGNHWMERVEERTGLFYGIIEADVLDETTLSLGYTNFRKYVDDATPHGTALRGDTDGIYQLFREKGRHFNPATQWSYAKQDVGQWFVQARHGFNDNWSMSASYQHTRNRPDRVYGILGVNRYYALTGDAMLEYGRIKPDNTSHNLDVSLLGKFLLWGRDAQIAAGFSGQKSEVASPAYWNSNVNWTGVTIYYNPDNWNNGDVPLPRYRGEILIDQHGSIVQNHEKSYGMFVSTKFKPLQDLSVIAGARRNRHDLTVYWANPNGNRGNPMNISQPSKIIPYVGLIYDLTPTTALYASYTGIYKQQKRVGGVTAKEREETGVRYRALPPVEGNTMELGIKRALFEDRLNLHAAAFRMHEKSLAQSGNNYYIAGDDPQRIICDNPYEPATLCVPAEVGGGPTISGLELSVAGAITERWMINAGYTYLHLKPYREFGYAYGTPRGAVDKYDFDRPKHSFSLFSSYKFTNALTVGGGVRWKSRTEHLNYSFYTYKIYDQSQGSYAVVDLMARYDVNKNIVLGLNVGNLFDRTYFANNLSSYFGAPRNVTASMSMKF